MRRRTLSLERIVWRGRQLWMQVELDGHPFATSLWYEDVDLDALEASVGRDALDRIAFHVAAFEMNKLCSLRPTHVSFGPWARFATRSFLETWRTVLVRVWAQWRWQHDLPDWRGPELVEAPAPDVGADRTAARAGDAEATLLFFGGGKDSVVAARLLDEAHVPWASLTYAHAVYGPPGPQHAIVGALLGALRTGVATHRQWVADDAFAAPLPALLPETGAKSLLAAETPSSIFAALPVVLAHGYRRAALAHEHSANRGNLVWDKTGEDVNHQWGKSWEAEKLLSEYVERELVRGFSWFSILQPLSDVLIFELCRRSAEVLPLAHSCNVKKPWCHRCAKCAYVALGYAAHLPDGIYERTFAEDVLDLEDNLVFFRQMIGLEGHTPFECIGEIDEARLGLALCAARGRRARAVALFEREGGPLDLDAVLARYAVVHREAPHGIPADVAARVMPIMQGAAESAAARIRGALAR